MGIFHWTPVGSAQWQLTQIHLFHVFSWKCPVPLYLSMHGTPNTLFREREIWNPTNICDHWGGTWHCYCNCWRCDHIPLLLAPYCSRRVLFLQDPTLQSKHELRVFLGTGKAMLEVCWLNINFLLKINRTKWSLQACGHQGSYFADAFVAQRSRRWGMGCSCRMQDPCGSWGEQGALPHIPRETLGSISAVSLRPPAQKLVGKMKPWWDPGENLSVIPPEIQPSLDTASNPHPCAPFPPPRMNSLANKNPANIRSLRKLNLQSLLMLTE